MNELSLQDFHCNPFDLFGRDWLALTAGAAPEHFNSMTIAWGHLGTLWERGTHANRLPTAIVYVRPSRYTRELLEQEPLFTLCHFPSAYRNVLGYLGSHSGKDGRKMEAAGLTPVFSDGTAYFAEADLIFICRKLYCGALNEGGFADMALVDFNYPEKDFHTMYVGEIIKVLGA